MRVCIIDCYTDEPAGLGVPPYLGTSPRYVFGAVEDAGGNPIYINIDDVRSWWEEPYEEINLTREPREAGGCISRAELVVILGGAHTPGKYLRGRPALPGEIRRIVEGLDSLVAVGGPVIDGTMGGGRGFAVDPESLGDPDWIIEGDPEKFIHEYLLIGGNADASSRRSYRDLERYALLGSHLLGQVRPGPDTVIEVETSRGCTRSLVGGCSFCSECSRFGLPEYREPSAVVSELVALRRAGARNVRLGRQSCFFSYMSPRAGKDEIPRPDPEVIEKLLDSSSRVGFNSLHIDNVNPAVVSLYPGESRMIVRSLVEHCTPGNVAALGVESADPAVIKENNLKCEPEDSLNAIRLFSEYGRKRGWNGQPSLLAGVNFVLGLPGESKNTYQMNRAFLETIVDEGLLVRRINIRKVIPVRGTPLWGKKWNQKFLRHSRSFTKWTRDNVDRPMLRSLYPVGTLMKGLVSEVLRGEITFSRFPGSYPVIVGVREVGVPRKVVDGIVVGHGYRSLTAVPRPLDINGCSQRTLESLPGIGSRRAARIARSRPLNTVQELEMALGHGAERALELISSAADLKES